LIKLPIPPLDPTVTQIITLRACTKHHNTRTLEFIKVLEIGEGMPDGPYLVLVKDWQSKKKWVKQYLPLHPDFNRLNAPDKEKKEGHDVDMVADYIKQCLRGHLIPLPAKTTNTDVSHAVRKIRDDPQSQKLEKEIETINQHVANLQIQHMNLSNERQKFITECTALLLTGHKPNLTKDGDAQTR